jgi:hypothetical protein
MSFLQMSFCASSSQAIETALDCLKSANTEPYYRRQAWEVIRCFLVAMMSLDDSKHALYQLLAHPKYVLASFSVTRPTLLQGLGTKGAPRCLQVRRQPKVIRARYKCHPGLSR